MQKKKLLFIVNTDWFFISHRLPIAIEAMKNGFEVHFATGEFTNKHSLINKKINTHLINLERKAINPISNLKTIFDIFILIRKIKPDIIHLITPKPVLLGNISCLLARSKVVIFSITGLGYLFTKFDFLSKIKQRFLLSLYRLTRLNKKYYLIFQNKFDKNIILQKHSYMNSRTSLIKGSGIDLTKYEPKSFRKGKPILLFASRLLVSKGIRNFIQASKIVKNARFVVVGGFDKGNPDSITKKEFYDYVDSGLIEYWGFRNSMEKILSLSSIVILPSFYGEGLPKILIEAAACGRPIITTDHPGCRDAIIPNKTGLLVPVRDTENLVIAINYLLKNQDKLIKMGNRARKFAEINFDINNVITKHLEIYKKFF